MDTLTVVSDTLAVKFKAVADFCQPCIDGTGTNFCDVLIVLIICICIGFIAACGISKYYNNKKCIIIYIYKIRMKHKTLSIRMKEPRIVDPIFQLIILTR